MEKRVIIFQNNIVLTSWIIFFNIFSLISSDPINYYPMVKQKLTEPEVPTTESLHDDQLKSNDYWQNEISTSLKQTIIERANETNKAISQTAQPIPENVDFSIVKTTQEKLNTNTKILKKTSQDLDNHINAINTVQSNSTSQEHNDKLKQAVTDAKTKAQNANAIFSDALNSMGLFISNMGKMILQTLKLLGQIISIIFTKIGHEIEAIAKEIGNILAKGAEEVFKALVSFGHDLEKAGKAIANFFSSIGNSISHAFKTPKYYVNGIRVPKEVHSAFNKWNAKIKLFTTTQSYYTNLKKICSDDSNFAYNTNIVRTKNILTGSGPQDMPAVFALLATDSIAQATSQAFDAIDESTNSINTLQQNISGTKSIPSPTVTQSSSSITLQSVQDSFGLSDALTFLNTFKQDTYFDDLTLLFDPNNFKSSTTITTYDRYTGKQFPIGYSPTLKQYPTNSFWEKIDDFSSINVIDWIATNKKQLSKSVSASIEQHLKTLRTINATIDQYRTLAVKKDFINKKLKWIVTIQSKLKSILFKSELMKKKNDQLISMKQQPSSDSSKKILSKKLYDIVIKTVSDITIGLNQLTPGSDKPSHLQNSIDHLYDNVINLLKKISPFAIHLVDNDQMEQLKNAGAQTQTIIASLLQDKTLQSFITYQDTRFTSLKKSMHESWKPDLQIVLNLFDYINTQLLNDSVINKKIALALNKNPSQFDYNNTNLSKKQEQQVNIIFEQSMSDAQNLITVINLIVSNQIMWAAAFDYKELIEKLLQLNPDLNNPLIINQTMIPSMETVSAGASLCGASFSISLFLGEKGISAIQNILMYQNFMLQLYGHTPLTAALSAKNNVPSTSPTQKSPPPQKQQTTPQTFNSMINYAASVAQNYIQPIILTAGSTKPVYPLGNPSIVQFLLEHGARTDVETLCTVFGDDNSKAIVQFVSLCTNNTQKNKALFATPLQWAVATRNTDNAELLLTYGALPSSINGIKPLVTMLDENFVQPHYPQLIKALINRGADDLTEALLAFFDPLFLQKNLDSQKNIIFPIVSMLIKAGANANPVDAKGNPVPLIALLVQYVIDQKINIQDAYLFIALLLQEGSSLDLQDSNGKTALIKASEQGFAKETTQAGEPCNIIQLLIRSGAGTTITDNNGKTAIDYTLKNGYLYTLPYLALGNAILPQQAVLYLNELLVITIKQLKNRNDKEYPKNFHLFILLINAQQKDAQSTFTANPTTTFANPNTVDTDSLKTSPLIYSVKNNNETVTKLLLQAGANPLYIDTASKTAADYAQDNSPCAILINKAIVDINIFMSALKANNSEHVKESIKNNVCINSTDKRGLSPLMYALQIRKSEDNAQIITILLDNGANLNIQDAEGKNPLMYAIESGDAILIEDIAQTFPPGLNQKDSKGKIALDYAITSQNNIIITLIKNVNEAITNVQKSTDLDIANEYSVLMSVYPTPQDNTHLASLETQVNTNVESLLEAAKNNDFEEVKKLITAINDPKLQIMYVNSQDSNGNTALLWAAKNNNLPMVTFLIDHNADIIHQDKTTNDSALTISLANKDNGSDVAQYLMKKLSETKTYSNPLNQGTFNADNISPLLIAASNNATDITESLFTSSINRNQRDNIGNTVVTYITLNNNLKLLQKITSLVDDPTAKKALLSSTNNVGFTPLAYALHNNAFDCVHFLLAQGVPIDSLSALIFLDLLNKAAKPLLQKFNTALNDALTPSSSGMAEALNTQLPKNNSSQWDDATCLTFIKKLISTTHFSVSDALFNTVDEDMQMAIKSLCIAPKGKNATFCWFTSKTIKQPILYADLIPPLITIIHNKPLQTRILL